jgi:hypothetical protein
LHVKSSLHIKIPSKIILLRLYFMAWHIGVS